MSKIDDIFTAAGTGLVPYLDATLTKNYSRFLIRPFNFGSTSLAAGLRLRDYRSENQGAGDDVVTATIPVLVGEMVAVTSNAEGLLLGAKLARDMDKTIRYWSRSVCRYVSAVDSIDGPLPLKQDRNITSENPNAWWVVVIRSFDVQYFEEI